MSSAILMGALVWAMQGWLPLGWALFGALLAVRLTLFSYWMNSYWGGALAAIGGALLLGSYIRIARQRRWAYAWLFGLGLVILAYTRMYEGLLFCLPVMVALITRTKAPRVWVPAVAVCVAGAVFLMFYNREVTGHALRLPYLEYDAQYAYAPQFSFQSLSLEKHYRHESIFNYFHGWQFDQWNRSRSWRLIPERGSDLFTATSTILGGAYMTLIAAGFLMFTWRDKRIRVAAICVATVAVGSFVQIVYYVHYFAPATVALLILAVQAFRHLRYWRLLGRPVGRFLTCAVPLVALAVTLVTEGSRIAHDTPETSQPVNARRDKLEAKLREQSLRGNVVIVRYTGHQNPHEEWVYNRANIDAQDVVWAHDMGPENPRLIAYYKDRAIWLFDPDQDPERLETYPIQ